MWCLHWCPSPAPVAPAPPCCVGCLLPRLVQLLFQGLSCWRCVHFLREALRQPVEPRQRIQLSAYFLNICQDQITLFSPRRSQSTVGGCTCHRWKIWWLSGLLRVTRWQLYRWCLFTHWRKVVRLHRYSVHRYWFHLKIRHHMIFKTGKLGLITSVLSFNVVPSVHPLVLVWGGLLVKFPLQQWAMEGEGGRLRLPLHQQ